jgi:hypothetical protein
LEFVSPEEFDRLEQKRQTLDHARKLLARLAEQDRLAQFVSPKLHPEAVRLAAITDVCPFELSAAFDLSDQTRLEEERPKPKPLSDLELDEILKRRGDQVYPGPLHHQTILPEEEARLVRDWAQNDITIRHDPKKIEHDLEALRVAQWLQRELPTDGLDARIASVALKYIPPNAEIRYSREAGGGGLSWIDGRPLIEVPKPVCPRTLRVFLHECAHILLHAKAGNKPSHIIEFEAESWTFETMRREGIPIPQELIDCAKSNVLDQIAVNEAQGIPIDPEARSFATRLDP